MRRFFEVYAKPNKRSNILLAVLPFILLLIVYIYASNQRLADNEQDKLLPSLSQMAHAVDRMAFTQDRRTGKYLLWTDSWASLKRLVIGVGLASICGLLLGLYIGLFRYIRSLFQPLITFISMVPPLAVLPILFISFGIGEVGKIMLIFIGIFPIIARDITLATAKIPIQQLTKALTLGATTSALIYRIVLPQIMPRLLDTVRLSLGAAWLFLIASEAIAATDGLGYRIFLVRRYLAMDVIIPYVLWITFLGYMMDTLLRLTIRRFYVWYTGTSH